MTIAHLFYAGYICLMSLSTLAAMKNKYENTGLFVLLSVLPFPPLTAVLLKTYTKDTMGGVE